MKKKILCIFLSLFITSFTFAGIAIQLESIPLGITTTYRENCFNIENPVEKNSEFFIHPYTMELNVLWEFDQQNTEKNFHFMTGLAFGISFGFSLKVPLIFEFTLARFKNSILELTVNPCVGLIHGIKGGIFFYYNPSINLVLSRPDRKWLYGGIGLASAGMHYCAIYKDYGKEILEDNHFGLNLFIGIRIPTGR